MLTSKEIRRKFLQYFESKGHEIVPSAPVVNKNDPTLMFINAGMNPFKDFFLGNATPKNARIADTQKCLRVSGKHNDLDEVGHDTYHHTLFEMLGNWSIGDYFKKEAIEWAWDLLTNVYGLDKDRLYVTVFEGDAKDDLPRDNEAADLWAQFVPAERILNGSKADNFWEMGETGPCGPCSEIHVDLRSEEERAKVSGASLVNEDHPQVVEIWNLVFMQFNRKASGELENLPAQHIDTGMGFERLCMALQGKQSNYDTDVFTPLIDKVAGISGIKYGAEEATDIAQRVIADHIRAVAFAIADGQLPASSGAGYVIRRILRRAIRYGFSYLNLKSPFMFQLVETLESEMGEFFPELTAQRALVEKVIEEEEQSFLKTLAQGLAKLEEFLATDAKVLDGKRAFELYDTYGFPIDLTELIMRENDRTVDMAGFTEEMTAQKERSRAATKLSTDDWVELEEDDKEEFIGYDYTEADVRITRYRKVSAKKKEFYQLVLSMTPFYAEGGGQVGDTGLISKDEFEFEVSDVQKKLGDLFIHYGKVKKGSIKLEQDVEMKINIEKRNDTRAYHSATHLLHESLRRVLGPHVTQKGSLVEPERLRFDFSHMKPISDDEMVRIESHVNDMISKQSDVTTRIMTPKEAVDNGALALFGEKYGDEVRVLSMGDEGEKYFSTELCGGTHVKNTGDIGKFKIISQSSIAAGVRRVEALRDKQLEDYLKNKEKMLNLSSEKDVEQINELSKQISDLGGKPNLDESDKKVLIKNLNKQLETLSVNSILQDQSKNKVNDLDVNGVKVRFQNVEDLPPKELRKLVDKGKKELGEGIVIVFASKDDKVGIAVGVTEKLTEKFDAVKFVKTGSEVIGGKGGGGRKDFAQAGGQDQSKINDAFEKIKSLI